MEDPVEFMTMVQFYDIVDVNLLSTLISSCSVVSNDVFFSVLFFLSQNNLDSGIVRLFARRYQETAVTFHFKIYITISTITSVRLYGVGIVVVPSSRHTFKFQIPAADSQNVSDKSCLACVQSEQYSFWFTLRPLGSMRQGEAELHTLQYQAR